MPQGTINIFDDNNKLLLSDFLKQFHDGPVRVKSFRLQHKDKKEFINFLENEQILRIEQSGSLPKTYSISYIGLYLSGSSLSKSIFETINKICTLLRKEYEADESDEIYIDVNTILNELNISRRTFSNCYYFLNGYARFAGTTNIKSKDAKICLNEMLTDFNDFSEIPERALKHEFSEDFNLVGQNKKRHGNTESNASKREAVLGAALAILTASPVSCKTKTSNKVQGAKITKIMEANEGFLFREQFEGKLPLEPRTITAEINIWLNKSRFIK